MRTFIISILLIPALHCASGQNILRDDVEYTYLSQIGVRQVGNNRGPQVEQYLAVTGLDGGYAWCAAFVAWVLTECNVSNPKSAWSPSYFQPSSTIWQYNKNLGYTPLKGDVMGIYYSNLKRIAHVGFVHRFDSCITITVEGNTNNNGSRMGDGVYLKRRPTRQIHSISRFIND